MNNKHLILALSLVLISGCAKKAEEAAESASAQDSQVVAQDAVQAADASEKSNEQAAENTVDTTPVTEQKPETILSTDVSQAEKARRMVREAQVNFTAKDVVKTALEIDKLTFQAGGFIEQKNISFDVLDKQTQKIGDGKIRVFEKVDPHAEIIVRVPSDKAAVYVNQLLPLMYFLNQQQYSAKRFELKLLEEKMAQTQTVPGDTKQSQLNEISRLTQLEVQDRVRFSTISITIKQPAMVRESLDVDVDAVARLNGDGFWKRAWEGVQYGWQFILDLLVILVTIWPLYLLIMVGCIIYRVTKPLLNKLFNDSLATKPIKDEKKEQAHPNDENK
ncbi:DUF4349 domain-containing protein [Acinetobacter bereziniae]|jgi:hypothetical protein|uniref:DUF4349 domain-containing protein n=1 Tax=Acinetobacter bereziniae LMG 1003 = CIP 70.12 TaxID=981324 RepID=N9ES55_ACIBZ|nr:DUF4349 domain-containing protein [Acinetobacter bereziniae]ENV95580.1 hypothetical protein F938_02275 [Acinetobacter bereziniae LMG 1003 = CIP 70.12]MDG3558371.1 DUF4349 domain-containing protein [Acinetobacter bereziniae]MDP6003823.1 DUF4349 domain-containing protein [Acinetobacter bereziniae]QQC78743.1 DUF4349 domain-containing protein [Acinetobacter bereziniae]UUN91806.1 DUF4349 domain-containing protein [Acinetobacter bereziniae]